MKIYVPADTTALSVGADAVAAQFAAAGHEVVRNGSRGLFWLEPLVEVQTTAGRVALGPLEAGEVEALLPLLEHELHTHPKYLGDIEQHPWLARQQRLTFARAGLGDPLCLAHYASLEGFAGLRRALSMSGQQIVDAVKASGLRGRGGASFPAGIKWQTVLDEPPGQKYIVCNADEGDSGTFADRLLMEADPYQLIEGMTIAGLAVGATRGYIYLRSEYPRAARVMEEAIARATEGGFLGDDILGSGRAFTLELRLGAGAYICGEETSLLNSLEGRRGEVRAKPPLPAIAGFLQRPTVVNNVLTLAAVTTILARGADFYSAFGSGRSLGTMPFQLAGNVRCGGLIEAPFGLSLRELVETYGQGTRTGRPVKAVQVGGPLGAYLPANALDVAADYESLVAVGGMLGHGGIVVFDDTADMAAQARYAMAFCAAESCGKCVPCRIGSTRGVEVIDRIVQDEARQDNVHLLLELCDTLEHASLCAMGGMTPYPVRSALRHWPSDFGLDSVDGER